MSNIATGYLGHYAMILLNQILGNFLEKKWFPYPILSENESTYCTILGWLNFDNNSTSLATSARSFVFIRDTFKGG